PDMSGISTGVGIFSGINTDQLIDQLLQIESRPKQLVQQRVLELQQQKAAFLDINSALLALKTAASTFATAKTFRTANAESSDPPVPTATGGTTAAPGTYSLTVRRLTTTQQLLTHGFTDSDAAGIGGARMTTSTLLSALNAGAGFQAGSIDITDAAGGHTTV